MIEYNFSTSRINISIYLNIFRLSFKMQMISKANIAYLSWFIFFTKNVENMLD